MDPISVTASVIAVATLAAQIAAVRLANTVQAIAWKGT
jgi:hypothetical protein